MRAQTKMGSVRFLERLIQCGCVTEPGRERPEPKSLDDLNRLIDAQNQVCPSREFFGGNPEIDSTFFQSEPVWAPDLTPESLASRHEDYRSAVVPTLDRE